MSNAIEFNNFVSVISHFTLTILTLMHPKVDVICDASSFNFFSDENLNGIIMALVIVWFKFVVIEKSFIDW